eukprot:scaffold233258_cov55-Attheya_sp.AAC.2
MLQRAACIKPQCLLATVVFLLALLICVHTQDATEEETRFFTACSSGDVELIAAELSKNKEWANTRTQDGETCLHLAAIPGSEALTKILLEAGADPNVRSTFKMGLRMHPLSWNVYGGHYKSAILLLDAGADIDADFDKSMEEDIKLTVLDVAEEIASQQTDQTEQNSFVQTSKLLKARGAKKYSELQYGSEL